MSGGYSFNETRMSLKETVTITLCNAQSKKKKTLEWKAPTNFFTLNHVPEALLIK